MWNSKVFCGTQFEKHCPTLYDVTSNKPVALMIIFKFVFRCFTTVSVSTECQMALNTDMALVNTKGHNERLAVSNNNEIFAVPNTNMLLRERIKRLMGKEIHVSWKSLPEVRSSGLLGKLSVWRF